MTERNVHCLINDHVIDFITQNGEDKKADIDQPSQLHPQQYTYTYILVLIHILGFKF